MAKKNKAQPEALQLKIEQVHKEFIGAVAVEDVSFRVEAGKVFALLGPNGAGKTTLMRMIMDIVRPDSGSIQINGQPRATIPRNRFGYLPEERGLYAHARVLELLVYFGTLNHMPRRKAEVEAIRFLDRLGLIDYSDYPIHYLSKGMQQKVQFIAAFLHKPDILILDEPFSGLDPINQIALREILSDFKKEGKLIILSTHQMEMAEKMCEHVCMIHQGRLIIDAPLKEIKKRFRDNTYLLEADHALETLQMMDKVDVLEAGSNGIKFRLAPGLDSGDLLRVISAKHLVRHFQMFEPSLHDIFIRLIQRETEELHA
ncbi:MAG TPA: ATP-binding cassette domain-containing protein [Caldithrix abyssi]|uniref:ATP-binding cassette domain-containing protein n=1 Tax=Caldithrix abyssi TaxID=187145 RepID=A0A7V5VFI6_CALAY|nr:ATP-binding cassette domain-containing protein [Caldithrix abyssi]